MTGESLKRCVVIVNREDLLIRGLFNDNLAGLHYLADLPFLPTGDSPSPKLLIRLFNRRFQVNNYR